ncbi:hypothetical protein GWK47_035821 [Chionoecetes opilio]|uniref:Uncharacterized protein n=1 Tax=Chionoecetes opilio TaxID=41210 RepID=A0A8J4YHS9_CHIOP|nr:hypothetical protein GWK47_035821 [Chionoecetes opilio]
MRPKRIESDGQELEKLVFLKGNMNLLKGRDEGVRMEVPAVSTWKAWWARLKNGLRQTTTLTLIATSVLTHDLRRRALVHLYEKWSPSECVSGTPPKGGLGRDMRAAAGFQRWPHAQRRCYISGTTSRFTCTALIIPLTPTALVQEHL